MSDTISLTNMCRICLEEEENIELLINPCSCRGTSKYVHKTCINQWFEETTNELAKKECMECKTPYLFSHYDIEENSKLLFQESNISSIYCKNILIVLPVAALTFTYDSITNNFYLIEMVFPTSTKTTFTDFIKENGIFGYNYYYYFFNYIFFYFFFLHYMYVVIFKMNRRILYVSKASFTIMMMMIYIILFFWINGILNMIMDIESIVLSNIISNLFSPHFIYKIVDHHKNILTDINQNISQLLIPYTNYEADEADEEVSDTDSETFLLHVEIE